MAIEIHLDKILEQRGMTAKMLCQKINKTEANISILRSGKAKAIRLSTLSALCDVLNCQPGDLLTFTN